MSHTTALVATRTAWHTVAEHVLAAARYAATGRIGLQPVPGGVATPLFGEPNERIRLDGDELVIEWGDAASRHELTTLGAAAAAAEVDLDAWHGLYPPATPADPSAVLVVDRVEAALLADWFALGAEALAEMRAATRADDPSEAQLWPEHFDLALSVRACNLGVSPGDVTHPEPYLYVGPHDPGQTTEAFWNEPFGASRPWRADTGVADAVAFFTEGLERLAPIARS